MVKYLCTGPAISVTVGKIYDGQQVFLEGLPYIRLVNDEGYHATYRPERFEEITFESFVKSRKKSPEQLYNEITPLKCDLNHMLIGLVGEVGELDDCVKKFTMYNKDIDLENFKEEVGDILFYLEGICQSMNVTMQECINGNIEKLSKRYSSGKYSNEEASERADKS